MNFIRATAQSILEIHCEKWKKDTIDKCYSFEYLNSKTKIFIKEDIYKSKVEIERENYNKKRYQNKINILHK